MFFKDFISGFVSFAQVLEDLFLRPARLFDDEPLEMFAVLVSAMVLAQVGL